MIECRMFDPFPTSEDASPPMFSMEDMVMALRNLDAAELARVEDDLDFYQFTGCLSERLKSLLAAARPLRHVA